MIKVCIIIIYFGKLPNYFTLWLNSIKKTNFDFLFVTDNDMSIYDLPANIIIKKSNLSEIKISLEKILGKNVILSNPYKLCDYKPFYGLIYKKELEGYNYLFSRYFCIKSP